MLIFGGSPDARVQRGMPFPTIKYGLAVPRGRRAWRPTLHAVGCAHMPHHDTDDTNSLRQIVWSTTYGEIEEYAGHQFGSEGWVTCPACGAIYPGDVR